MMSSPNKVLCLGANVKDTDLQTTLLASQQGSINRGLLADTSVPVLEHSFYHTSTADLSIGDIVSMAKRFDLIIMLDQERSVYPHHKSLQSTYRAMCHLESMGMPTQFRDNANVRSLERIEQLVSQNKTWCIFPWIQFASSDPEGLRLCDRSITLISDKSHVKDWMTSSTRKKIQEQMLRGERLPDSCATCYRYEDMGIESYRQYESRDWLHRLGIDDLAQLDAITYPKYYVVYWSNLCNLKCRGCRPSRSSAIDKEFKKHKITMPFQSPQPDSWPTVDAIHIPTLDSTSRVYVTGGEPVIMPETIEFMQRCVQAGRTDFHLTMSTNGQKIPARFRELSKKFSNINLSFSLDGFDKVNDYWRSGATWSKIVANMRDMQSLGHAITVNCVPGIYNVTNLHLLFEWLDQEFPLTSVYLQINHNAAQSAYNHPRHDLVIHSMRRCQQTKVYWSDAKSCKTAIDSILSHYEKGPACKIQHLRQFFHYNDELDRIRHVRLADYIPELEACRPLTQ